MFYRLQGGKEEAFALYGAAFMLCSFRTTFLLLAILSPINPELAPRERLGGPDCNRQRAAGSRAGTWGTGSGRLLCIGVRGAAKGVSPRWGLRGDGGFPAGPPNSPTAPLCCCSAAALQLGLVCSQRQLRATQQQQQHCLGGGRGVPDGERRQNVWGESEETGTSSSCCPNPAVHHKALLQQPALIFRALA